MKNMKIHYIFSVDRKLRINSCSKELEEILRKPSSEVQGILYHKIIPRIKKDGRDAVAQALKNGKAVIVREHHSTCFCGHTTADIHITPVKDKTGKISGADVSIEGYPGCVIWERLKQSERFIDMGKISATFAHGVRSPLNAIKGAVVYLRKKYANEEKLIEFTNIMEEEISRLDNFIAKFLSTTISDQGLTETDLIPVLKKIETLTSLQAQSRNIQTFFENGYTAPVMINSFYLEHAILNVINNAIDAMPSGGRLAVKTESKISSGSEFAVIEISDTGSGMMGNNKDGIPGPSKKQGKGLGLFITREILRSCGGHLEINSKRDLGTTVKLYIPTGQEPI